MQIKILFDSIATNNQFLTGWGLAYLIDNEILFDTGENSISVIKNMRNMDVKISDIKAIVISHDHLDHWGGLWGILEINSKVKVYICPNFSQEFRKKAETYGNEVIEASKFREISKDIYTTGEIEGEYNNNYMPEQALVLDTSRGLVIITGCAHSGIIKIVHRVKQAISKNIYLVLGGFHLIDKNEDLIISIAGKFKQLGIEKVAPSHCSGDNAQRLFKESYKENYIQVKVGQTLEI